MFYTDSRVKGKIMEIEYQMLCKNDPVRSSEAILEIEHLSSDENLILNDIFDECFQTSVESTSTQPQIIVNNNDKIITITEEKCEQNNLNPSLQKPNQISQIRVESNVTQNNKCNSVELPISANRKEIECPNTIKELITDEPIPFLNLIRGKEIICDSGDNVNKFSYKSEENIIDLDSESDDSDSALKIDIETDETVDKKIPELFQTQESLQCVTCNTSFTDTDLFFDHILDEHEQYFFMCKLCNKKIKLSAFIAHGLEHNQLEKTTVPTFCQICCISIWITDFSVSFMKNHMIKHIDVQYKCVKCDEMFPLKKDFTQHLACHNKLCCSDCNNIVFKTRKMFQQHLKFHQNSPLKCNECDKTFFVKSLWHKHKISHSKYHCIKCKKIFPNAMTMRIHENEHLYKYICNFCDKTFKKEQSLCRHKLNLHPNEKETAQYECLRCKKTFKTMVEYSLHSHI